MTLNLHLPTSDEILKPTITVIGVGGAGGNAVNNMISANLAGVDFVAANTDAQALENSLATHKVQLGGVLTKGLGAGANPDIGRAATEEVAEDIARHIEGSNMVFITAGMGGGTGTGAAPVVARIAREQGVLTVAVVTKPFQFEGSHRMRLAEAGLKELQQYVDTLIIIPNQNLFRIANERTTFADAFKLADEVLHSGVRGVTDLMVKPGLINLDFADIRAVMQEMGKAMMGTGESTGERRAIEAAEAAISNPLLDDVSLKGAKSLLINITGGMDMTLFEVDEAANRIRQEVDADANIIFGSAFNDDMEGRMRVSVVATGIDGNQQMLDFQATQAQQRHMPEVKKPFMFSANNRPEPVKINPRTAADVATSAPMRPATAMQAAPKAEQQQSSEAAEDAATETMALAMAKQIIAEQKQQRQEDQAREQHHQQQHSAPHPEPSSRQQPQERASHAAESGSIARPIVTPAYHPAEGHGNDSLHQHSSAADISPRAEQHETLFEQSKDLPNTRSLFQKIADVSKVLSNRSEQEPRESRDQREQREVRTSRESAQQPSPQASQSPHAVQAKTQERSLQVKQHKRDKTKAPTLFDQEEQYIDIPAFLRRQAQ